MLIQCDASQLEWRTILELSQDEVGIQEVEEGQDTHSLNEKAFELPSRLIAKIYLFRTIFRGSGWSFANDPQFMHVSKDPKFWDEIGEKFFKKYAGINRCHHKWAEIVMSGKPIEGPLGRSWSINNRDKQGNVFVPWTTLTNYPVQGTGADVMMIARVSLARRLKTLGWPVLLVSTVHDSIVIDAPDEYLERVSNLMYQVFDDLPANIKKLFGYDWCVRMDCEVKYGKDMKNMSKFKRTDK
jgi:DNA polymerase-1